jgi:hypothetical protein
MSAKDRFEPEPEGEPMDDKATPSRLTLATVSTEGPSATASPLPAFPIQNPAATPTSKAPDPIAIIWFIGGFNPASGQKSR